jgi:hypothetical protein
MKIIYLATARVLSIGRRDRYHPQTAFHILGQPIYMYLLHAAKSQFFPPKILCISQRYFFHKTGIFTLYIKDALKHIQQCGQKV